MIATHPPSGHREPMDILHVSILIALLLSPFLVKAQFDLYRHRFLAEEYRSSRESILSRIDSAAAFQDVKTLTHLQQRYGHCVSDRAFHSSIQRALAKAASRNAQLKLAMSRHLDLVRLQEEFGPSTVVSNAPVSPISPRSR